MIAILITKIKIVFVLECVFCVQQNIVNPNYLYKWIWNRVEVFRLKNCDEPFTKKRQPINLMTTNLPCFWQIHFSSVTSYIFEYLDRYITQPLGSCHLRNTKRFYLSERFCRKTDPVCPTNCCIPNKTSPLSSFSTKQFGC